MSTSKILTSAEPGVETSKKPVPQGRALGAALAVAERAWVSAGFPQERRALDDIADAAAKSAAGL